MIFYYIPAPHARSTFVAGVEPIPGADEKPPGSIGREFTAEPSDRQTGKLDKQQLAEGLAKIEQSQLPWKHKVWCY